MQLLHLFLYLFLINFTPSNLRLDSKLQAGFGVFAGRAFKKDEPVLRSWMTMFLPLNFPIDQAAWNYVFGLNETHKALALDYASVANHHESANTKVIHLLGLKHNIEFQVRRDFQYANHNVLKIRSNAHIHNRYTCT